jgi:hypothetical protein
METIINENYGEESTKTSESICDASSPLTRQIPTSYSSSSVVCTHRSNIQEKLTSDIRSAKPFSSLNNLSRSHTSNRRTTLNCLAQLNNDEGFNKRSFLPTTSHQSIDIIKENNFSSYFDENVYPKSYPQTTKIKLSLPRTSSGLNPRRRYHHKNSPNSNSVQGEFTLPTNPPITVTIQPQNNLNEINEKDHSLHDDQIYSPDHIKFINQQRISLDTSLKGTSTIVNYFMDLLKPSDNKLAMKLFGSKKGVLKERLRQQRAGHCIIHPCSNFR